MAYADDAVTQAAIKGTGYALIVVTSLVILARYAASIRSIRDLKAEDYLLLVAYAFFIELTVLYILITPAVFRLAALQQGTIPPYPTIAEDSRRMQIFFFVTTSSLWLCLWMVKFSLLAMYKRLIGGKAYIIAWWTIMTLCVLFLIGCILSSWFSCSSFHAWFTAGACNTPRDHRAAAISLYYAYAVDLVTDFAIMVLPLRLIWNLRMKRSQKLSIGGLFCIGWICIIVATIRVAQLGNNSSNGQPKPSWLALWAIIEASIAVMIGNAPGLYRVLKAHISRTQQSYRYDSHGFRLATHNNTPGLSYSHRSRSAQRDIALSHFTPGKSHGSAVAYGSSSPASSQEKLADRTGGNITVTSQVAVTVGERDDSEEDLHGTRFFGV